MGQAVAASPLTLTLALTLAILACRWGLPNAGTPTAGRMQPATSTLPERPAIRPAATAGPTASPPAGGMPEMPEGRPASAPTPAVHPQTYPLYELVFSVPVGEGGVRYRGLDVRDMEITGPNNLAVLADGSFVIADLIENRLLWYTLQGERLRTVELADLDILNVSNLRSDRNELLLLEISFEVSPERYRAHRLSGRGELLASYDIPWRLEDGLSGIAAGCSGEILIELEGGAMVYQLVDENGDYQPRHLPRGYPCLDRHYKMLSPLAMLGSARVETTLTNGYGGLSLLRANPDGSCYLVREDVVGDAEIIVDRTVHFMDAAGRQVVLAREPIDERLYYVPGSLDVGPDGEVYHLLPRREWLEVVRLNFFPVLEPLMPGAEPPAITTIQEAP
jgi:hypothetical protein